MSRRYSIEKERCQSLILQLTGELASEVDVLFAYFYGSSGRTIIPRYRYRFYLDTIGPEGSMQSMLTMAARLSARVQLPIDVRLLNHAPVSFLYHAFKGGSS